MLHRFSIGLRSGEHAGHSIISPFLTRTFFKKLVVTCAAWEGALSCIKTILLQKAKLFFLCHGNQCSLRNAMYVGAVIFTPSLTRKGPTSSSWMIATQNITPPPPCRRLIRCGHNAFVSHHPRLQPSGPSRVARHSSVNNTNSKFCFKYFFAHSSLFSQ